MSRLRVFGLVVLVAVLLAGCLGPVKKVPKQIRVEWSVVKSNPGVVSIEASGKRHAYQNSTADGTWIYVEAELIGATRTKPFEFAVVSDDAAYAWERVDDSTIRIEPSESGTGYVLVTYDDLQETVPFAIFPTAVLTNDIHPNEPEREGNGWSFATGEPKPPGQGDVYVDMNARMLYATYGYAEEPNPSFWGKLIEPRDVTELEFSDPGASFEPQLGKLYTIRTADGGYAQFFISSMRFGVYERYNLIYNYSPTGIFE